MKSIPQPIETFYPKLAIASEVETALKEKFGARAAGIIKNMKSGETFDEDAEVNDLITDYVKNHCDEVDIFYGHGSAGFFPITICSLGGVSFIRASEFDDIGYFNSVREARLYAADEYDDYGPFVDDPDAYEDDEGDDGMDDDPENE
jgi:hypothetical protein